MARLDTLSDLQVHGTEPRLNHAISLAAAGVSYSAALDLRNYNVGNIESALNMTALVGGTLDIVPQISHDKVKWIDHNAPFAQQSAGAPDDELHDIKNFLGNFVRFKFTAGAGLTSGVGTLWAVGKSSS